MSSEQVTDVPTSDLEQKISRRDLLKLFGALAGTAVVGGCDGGGGDSSSGSGGGEKPTEKHTWSCKVDNNYSNHSKMRKYTEAGVLPVDMEHYVLNTNSPIGESIANLRDGVVLWKLSNFNNINEVYWAHPAGRAGVEKMTKAQFRASASGLKGC